MDIYLVGGAVRDQLLGRDVFERDWVVVGATPEQLMAHGYTPVGKDFPVFLHPDTGEEYALARTERKTGRGYTGFSVHADPNVTLEEDLLRRDLTINAIAQCEDGTLIDPFDGQADIERHILRHVSPAFVEDPVRILRVARFAARFNDFSIHPDTMSLMQQMVEAGEVDDLVAERVWKECVRALGETAPERFFSTLHACGALTKLFPELPYPDAMTSLARTVVNNHDATVRFASLWHSVTDLELRTVCQRLRTPSEFTDLARLVAQHHHTLQQLSLKDAPAMVELLEKVDAFRRPQRVQPLVETCYAIHPELDPRTLPTLEAAVQASLNVNAQPFVAQGLKNEAIGQAVHQARIERVEALLKRM